jgi:hypothetical protein
VINNNCILFGIFYAHSINQTNNQTGENKMRVFLTANDSGYSDWVENVRHGMTVSEFITEHCPDRAPSDLLIRVNHQGVEPSYVLNDGDRVTATPRKVEGGN